MFYDPGHTKDMTFRTQIGDQLHYQTPRDIDIL
jgi:hypothetical protein